MQPGVVLFHKRFAFNDGASADKLLVVLAVAPAHLVVAKTTSQGKRYRIDHGCQAGSRFAAFLLTQGCCFLVKNTSFCLTEFYELSPQSLSSKMVAGEVYKAGHLSNLLTRDVQACAAQCDDISQSQEALVRACFVNP